MIILSATVEPLGLGAYRVAWTGVAGTTVRVFVNGLLAFGPRAVAEVEKSVDLSLPDPCHVEVHENDADETVVGASIPLERKPIVWWSSRAGAVEYRVYNGSQLLAVVTHDPSRRHHELEVSQDLRQDGGVWTGLRVEAVSAKGVETVRAEFPLYAPGVPLAPTAVEVTGTGGVFDVELIA